MSNPVAQLPVWAAPFAHAPIDARVEVPGSKSLTNRALPLAALADGPSKISGALTSRDTDLMIAGLRALGCVIETDDGGATVVVRPAPFVGGVSIDCGLAGTVMRFLPVVAALADGPVSFDGDPAARHRPMGPVLDGLAQLGVEVAAGEVAPERAATVAAEVAAPGAGAGSVKRHGFTQVPNFLPVTVTAGSELKGGKVRIDSSGSSQFVSALLMLGARLPGGLTIEHTGDKLPSRPHIDMTVAALRERGVRVDEPTATSWRVAEGPIAGLDVDIEPDLSNAAPFLAAAVATGGRVSVPRWPASSTQPGMLLAGFLEQFGATSEVSGGVLTVRGPQHLAPADLDLSAAGELGPTLAALAALAPGRSTLRGIGHLRGHETNRLAALVTEIERLGGSARELEDGLEIDGGGLHGARLESYADHRMATFGAVIGLAVPGVEVIDIATTGKTIPNFPELWRSMIETAGN